LVGPLGGLPVVGRTETVSAGLRLSVRVPLGRHTGHLADAGEALAAALRVKEVRVTRDPDDASMATVVVVRHDPLAGTAIPWLWREATSASLWQPIPIGKDEDGQTVHVNLPEHNLLLGGEPGSGKSAVVSLLVAASALDPDVTLTLLDGKQVELAPWSKCADRFVGPDTAEAIEVLEGLRSEMDTRYGQLLAAGKRKIEPEDGLGLHVVAVDELAFYLRGGKRDDRAVLTESFRDLVSRGRAAGIIVLAATQKPSHEVIPTWIRDLFSFRLALRCTTPEASDTVLGQGWASQGFSAANIDPAARGVGFLLHEGGVPIKLRAAYLDDADIAALAERAAALRGGP
jgi:DNA segregation ATPase FtsK/SpoIIIE-like protein